MYICKKLCDYIGFLSPLLFAILIWISIRMHDSKNLWNIYLIGLVLNTLLTIFLKYKFFEEHNKKEGNDMPSGHFQSMSYSFIFYLLTIKNMQYFYAFLFLYIFIALCTFYNCIHYKYHTIHEIIIGSLVGLLFGAAFSQMQS